jgi:nitroreductase
MGRKRYAREDYAMNVIEAIKTRKSVREYTEQPIEEATLRAVLEAGRLAPSAGNRQEWRFIVVRDAATRQQLAAAANRQAFVGEAPAVIVACAEDTRHTMTCGQPSYPIDVAIALDHITLAAVEQGLGTCWVGAFDENLVKRLLYVPRGVRVVELMPIGHPRDPSLKAKTRLPYDTIVKHERW